ncbi:MAG TPA: ester cyclase [Chitinophagales bacterium]|nr:ester cyclase [Chitinophagales bacterium]
MKTINLILSAAMAAMTISCQQPASRQSAEPASPPPPSDHSALINNFLAAMDANDSTTLFANCSENFIVYHPSYPLPLDRAGFMKHIRAVNAALTGAKHTLLESISSANGIAGRGTVTGKHTGVFNGIPPSNNDINVDWLSFAVMDENGKLKTLYIQFNQMAFMSQMGVKMPGS